MLLQNIYNFDKYVTFEENCKIIKAINKLEEVGSHVKAIVLESDMNNIKEGMILDIYSLNKLYIKDYEERKDNRDVEVSHNGTRTIVNPFKNVKILIQETEQKTVSKIPFLGDLPLLGPLFRSSSTSKAKSELVIMITPRILNDDEGAIADSL